MTYEIRFDDGEEKTRFSLASSHGWTLFIKWVESLPKDQYRHLFELCVKGKVLDTFALSNQLKSALRKHKPKDEGVLETAKYLRKNIGIGDPVETAMVTDGANDDDEDDEDDDDDEAS